ncbi:NDP-sugar synthase [Pontibacter locisalis]|uniref:glucose-1-phosphate thymidylyltransferase n=1 Tax=Pontibacter locisalis TaxID=1719035 RepID=A0ABW5IPK9_9BACT
MSSTSIVGLIPAAGLGSRLQPLPCSKELFPIGFGMDPESQEQRPKVVSSYLIEHMQRAGAEQVYFILRKGKWDIPAYFGDGSALGVNLAYLIMGLPYGTPFSLDQAYSFVKEKLVIFGFPDILVSEPNAYARLLAKQAETKADVVLGIFEAESPEKWDVVDLQSNGSINSVYSKPHQVKLPFAWAFACWTPAFTAFMHAYLQQMQESISTSGKELSIGQVIQAAITNGLKVKSLQFSKGICLDVGTAEDLRKAIIKNT